MWQHAFSISHPLGTTFINEISGHNEGSPTDPTQEVSCPVSSAATSNALEFVDQH